MMNAYTVVLVSSSSQYYSDKNLTKGSRSNKENFVNMHSDNTSKVSSDETNHDSQETIQFQSRICKGSRKTIDTVDSRKKESYMFDILEKA